MVENRSYGCGVKVAGLVRNGRQESLTHGDLGAAKVCAKVGAEVTISEGCAN